ncbi:MAG: NeuD/PglB/VioB family sugar acetyltransferase [Anaerolineales bacterium]
MEPSATLVSIPLLNPNEPEARIVSLVIQEGQFVEQGELLCTLETTKSTAEVIAEVGGFIISLQFSEGDTAQAGAPLCYLASSEDWKPEEVQIPGDPGRDMDHALLDQSDLPAGLRISQPALKLAQLNQLDLTKLPVGPIITESMVRKMISKPARLDVLKSEFDPTALIVYGGGGHGKSVIDLVRSLRIYRLHGIVDDGLNRDQAVMGVPVLGGSEILPELHAQGVRQAINAVGGIGDITSRIKVFQLLAEHGFVCPIVIHPSAVVEPSSITSSGAQVFPHAYVGSDAHLGFGAIINTGAIVSHDCFVDDFANISPGAILAGGVNIGKGSLVGMGVTVNLGVIIGDNTRIGNSAVVKEDVPENSIVRAGMIWPE